MTAWDELALYESRDLVERKYREYHELTLSAEKAREIVSAVAQAREFFRSAADAAELVRPLLLYYGVLALARALILFRKPPLRESGLKKAHGLSVVAWEEQLAGGLHRLPEVRIRFESGTASELAEATGNRERAIVRRAPFPRVAAVIQDGSTTYPAGLEVTAKELLARIPDLAELYEEIFAEHPACYSAHVFVLSATTHTDIDVFPVNGRLVTDAELRRGLRIPDDVSVRKVIEHNFQPAEPHWSWRVEHASDTQMLAAIPPLASDLGGSVYLVEPLSGGVRLATLSVLFSAAFVGGMLARYYPTYWLGLLGRQKGDAALPLLRATQRIIRARFPRLVLDELG